ELSFSGGGSSLTLNPAGVFLSGPVVNLNSGGGGGSAEAASPKAPGAPRQGGGNRAHKPNDQTRAITPPGDDAMSFKELAAKHLELDWWEQAKGGMKKFVNEFRKDVLADQAEWFAEQGVVTFKDTKTGEILTPEQAAERYREGAPDLVQIEGEAQQA